jgi:hypothetical protein
MNFTIYNASSIAHSPAPCAKTITLALEEEELVEADQYQYERFWKVWHQERSTFAPNLEEVTIVLRPRFNKTICRIGINKFLDYYNDYVKPNCKTTGLHIYLDCWSSLQEFRRYQVLDAPELLLTIASHQKKLKQ